VAASAGASRDGDARLRRCARPARRVAASDRLRLGLAPLYRQLSDKWSSTRGMAARWEEGADKWARVRREHR
jgi:hypothetical protein